MEYFIAFLLSLMSMLWITPKLRAIAFKTNYVEQPKKDCERKIHKEPKPYLAAVGIFGVFWIVYFLVSKNIDRKILCICIGATLVFTVGMLDDWIKIRGKDLSALPKMLVQLLACVIVYFGGVQFIGFTNPVDGTYVLLPTIMQFILTIVWLFGVTTVINFTDGMDGLAGGVSCISSFTLFIVAFGMGDEHSAMMAIILVGVCLGYLRYNKFPAKILMGDAGATFIGFILGVIALDGAFKQATMLSIFVPILALGLPIFDNIYVVLKRMKEGKPIYVGDASQVHFRLVAQGLTQKQAVYVLYLVTACFNLSAIILYMINRM
ncbi:MAG: undecaprenyl/decaprenyl-phosphate alpha-N-acetylglucosaminyl 1-phosphate transferase [Cellulosilyticum sp.]|nr:undecaprenyl/decaprenyl-phosphate alpha-N-acetylglucosaminyl 1-phosphate transferase [Cellulosilyticum sp.]